MYFNFLNTWDFILLIYNFVKYIIYILTNSYISFNYILTKEVKHHHKTICGGTSWFCFLYWIMSTVDPTHSFSLSTNQLSACSSQPIKIQKHATHAITSTTQHRKKKCVSSADNKYWSWNNYASVLGISGLRASERASHGRFPVSAVAVCVVACEHCGFDCVCARLLCAARVQESSKIREHPSRSKAMARRRQLRGLPSAFIYFKTICT